MHKKEKISSLFCPSELLWAGGEQTNKHTNKRTNDYIDECV